MSRPDNRRRTLFLLLCAVCALATIIYGIGAARRSRPSTKTTGAKPRVSAAEAETVSAEPGAPGDQARSALAFKESTRAEGAAPRESTRAEGPASTARGERATTLLYFRANSLGDNHGKLSVAALDALDRPRYSTALVCDRVHFAGGKGICLASDRGLFPSFSAVKFEAQLRGGWTIKLNGFPSRVRVSPSGRLAAVTAFITGHSYASLSFSTETTIIDVDRGEVLTDLEQFSVSRNGAVFQAPDFNYWGVTFAHDENRFYATLWSLAKTYLIEGDLARRTANVIYEWVECPSLSPDNTRIAFKRRTGMIGGPVSWQISLLDLKTLTETALGETRSVDDQVEWLDNEHILYALSENGQSSGATADIWALPTGPDGSPQLFLKGAFSPAVVPGRN
jgi:hypothetical protein